jgi:bifunctional UDP-N-acetylglucosamine pyrophosphorylase/glucosamine-1-phosphate N-acetyltransferase
MQGLAGNKTLLPLKPEGSPFQGSHPILAQVLKSLPAGPKALVIHHYKEEVMGLDDITALLKAQKIFAAFHPA